MAVNRGAGVLKLAAPPDPFPIKFISSFDRFSGKNALRSRSGFGNYPVRGREDVG